MIYPIYLTLVAFNACGEYSSKMKLGKTKLKNAYGTLIMEDNYNLLQIIAEDHFVPTAPFVMPEYNDDDFPE